jgi:hypothetical protein
MINWLTALKILPWSDMIEYAPKVVSGAQKVWQRVKTGKDAMASADANALPSEPLTELEILQQELRGLQAQQLDLTSVIKDLAGQNQRLVDAINVLRARTRLLLYGFGLNALALIALVAWYSAH